MEKGGAYLKKNESEIKQFMYDMKIMYRMMGKRMLKEVLKAQAILIVMIFGVFYSLEVPMRDRFLICFIPIIAFVPGYAFLYFSTYRVIIRSALKEYEVRSKYKDVFKKFNQTY